MTDMQKIVPNMKFVEEKNQEQKNAFTMKLNKKINDEKQHPTDVSNSILHSNFRFL